MKKTPAHIQLTIPVRMTYIASSNNYKMVRNNHKKKSKPYYTKTSLFDNNGEPLVERDFEG